MVCRAMQCQSHRHHCGVYGSQLRQLVAERGVHYHLCRRLRSFQRRVGRLSNVYVCGFGVIFCLFWHVFSAVQRQSDWHHSCVYCSQLCQSVAERGVHNQLCHRFRSCQRRWWRLGYVDVHKCQQLECVFGHVCRAMQRQSSHCDWSRLHTADYLCK
jgi:hypothetical protein